MADIHCCAATSTNHPFSSPPALLYSAMTVFPGFPGFVSASYRAIQGQSSWRTCRILLRACRILLLALSPLAALCLLHAATIKAPSSKLLHKKVFIHARDRISWVSEVDDGKDQDTRFTTVKAGSRRTTDRGRAGLSRTVIARCVGSGAGEGEHASGYNKLINERENRKESDTDEAIGDGMPACCLQVREEARFCQTHAHPNASSSGRYHGATTS